MQVKFITSKKLTNTLASNTDHVASLINSLKRNAYKDYIIKDIDEVLNAYRTRKDYAALSNYNNHLYPLDIELFKVTNLQYSDSTFTLNFDIESITYELAKIIDVRSYLLINPKTNEIFNYEFNQDTKAFKVVEAIETPNN